jgi:hypothetical protein
VIGYRFKIPSDDVEGPVPSGFTLLTKTGLNEKLLKKLTIKSAKLSSDQVSKLMKATFSASERSSPAACYDPHHIFVFYAEDGSVTNAIEVCFYCTGVSTRPPIKEEDWYRHDFLALARLADECGLWIEKRTVKAYETLQLERKGL